MSGGRGSERAITDQDILPLRGSMGAEAMGVVPVDTTFSDAKVCKNYLCGTCPHDLFTNTVSCSLLCCC